MTISSTARVAGPYFGNGTTATFPFAFKVFKATDLFIETLNVATGAMVELQLTTDYTAALNEDQDSSPGGSITLTAGNLATGMSVTITTLMPALQGTDLTNGGAFYPDVINGALDTLTILLQQALAQLSLAIQGPVVDGVPNLLLPPAAQRAGKLLMFDALGNLQLVPVAPGSSVPGAQAATGTIDGTNKTFEFVASAGATPAPLVFAGGVFQTPGTDYPTPTLVSGTTWQIVFTNAPTEGPITVALFA